MSNIRWLVGGPGGALPELHRGETERSHCSFSRVSTDLPGLPLYRCVTGPSDILYLPDGWAHATCGLATFNVGVGYIGSVSPLPALHRAAVTGDLQALDDWEVASPALKGAELAELAGAGMLNEAGLPPLHWAAWNGHVAVMRKLMKWMNMAAGATAAAGKSRTQPAAHATLATHALRWAAARGHSSASAFLVQQIGQIGHARDEEGTDGKMGKGWKGMERELETIGNYPKLLKLLKQLIRSDLIRSVPGNLKQS